MYKLVWKIENFSYFKGETFLSPSFNDYLRTSQLSITHGHSDISAYVTHLEDYADPSVYCSVSILNSDGTPLINKVCIIKRKNSNVPTQMAALIFPNKAKYFPNNTLRVECYIWWSFEKFPPPASLIPRFAFTRVEPNTKVVKKTFRPQVSGFRDTHTESAVINEAIWNEQYFTIEVRFPNNEQADLGLFSTSLFGFQAKIKVFVVVPFEEMMECGNYDVLFTSTKRSFTFKLNASRSMFLCHENKFLPSGTLSLVINCTFSGHFATDSIVEESDIFNNGSTNNASNVAKASETKADETETDSDEPEPRQEIEANPPKTIVQTLQDILKKGYLSDFNLKVGDKVFPVHKIILGARSKFFEAMFDSEMKETQDNCVDIKDVDADTLQRLLLFIYSDRLDEDLDWAGASSLYAAADFYALEPLKQGCSEILKDGLSTTSALGVLHMADLHQDRQLKSAALDFISLNDKDIIGTEDWIKFEKDNGNLALETFRELYSRKMKG